MLAGVSQTAVLTLRARADEHARPDRLFADPLAADWFARVAWPPALDAWYADGAQTNVAIRVDDLDRLLRRALEAEPADAVVELGAGLSTRAARLADLDVAWWAVDLPEVAALREGWGAPGTTVAGSVLEPGALDAVRAERPVLLLEGLLYYLPRPAVDALLARLADRWPGALALFDVLGPDDFPALKARTEALGAPARWHLERPIGQVFAELGLDPVAGFEPDRVLQEALTRYLPRLPPAAKVLSWWALEAGAFPPRRSGNVVGRLVPRHARPT